MTDNPHKILEELKPEKEFFIGIDSDGCVFDTMEIKQKESFCPMFIKYFKMQKISKYARETWEFVNLYSTTRGINRFKALVRAFELLKERPEVKARNMEFMDIAPVIEWVNNETKLGNPALEKYAAEVKIPIIDTTLAWSKEVNKIISEIVFEIPPFPFVKESLEKMYPKADLMVVSQTPVEALTREWKEHNIDGFCQINCRAGIRNESRTFKVCCKGKISSRKKFL